MRWLWVALGVLVAAVVVVLIVPPVSNPALAHELIRMARVGDSTQGQRVKQILDDHGWPDEREVGTEGAHAAWQLVQQSSNVALQQEGLELMKRDADHVSKADVAYLTDRILVAQGQPQLYGTQYMCLNDSFVFATPIADPAHFRERRQAAGLGGRGFFQNGLDGARCGGEIRRTGPATTIPQPGLFRRSEDTP